MFKGNQPIKFPFHFCFPIDSDDTEQNTYDHILVFAKTGIHHRIIRLFSNRLMN